MGSNQPLENTMGVEKFLVFFLPQVWIFFWLSFQIPFALYLQQFGTRTCHFAWYLLHFGMVTLHFGMVTLSFLHVRLPLLHGICYILAW